MNDENKPCKSTAPKSLEDRIMNSNIPKSESEWWAKKEIEKLREQILSITNRPSKNCGISAIDDELKKALTTKAELFPLDEKEVEKFIKKYDKTIWECVISAHHDTGCWSGLWLLLDTISKDIAYRFSKPEIKWIENPYGGGTSGNYYQKAIDDMKRLNGEGGV